MSEPKTEHVFAGQPDDRQGGDIRPSRFRPVYRALSAGEKALHDAIKAKATELEALIESTADVRGNAGTLPAHACDREIEESIKNLELTVIWAIKGLTA